MALYRPHAVLVWPLEEAAGADGILGNPSASGSAATAQAYFEPLTTDEALERYGVELRLPGCLMVEVADAAKFSNGSEVLTGGRYYTVVGEPLLYSTGLETDHAEILIEGKDIPLEGV